MVIGEEVENCRMIVPETFVFFNVTTPTFVPSATIATPPQTPDEQVKVPVPVESWPLDMSLSCIESSKNKYIS